MTERSRRPRPTDLIFDFFGTLVSYTPGAFVGAMEYEATHRFLLDRGYTIDYADLVANYLRVAGQMEEVAKQSRIEYHMHDVGQAFLSHRFGPDVPRDVLEGFIETFVMEWNRGTVLHPEIAPFLERLSRHFRLSIISNTHYPPLIHDNLQRMGVAHRFSQIVTSIEHGFRKPDPRIFRDAVAGLGIAPAAAVYIGDTLEDDYHGARAAGLRAILIDPTGGWRGLIADRVDHLFGIESLLKGARQTFAQNAPDRNGK